MFLAQIHSRLSTLLSIHSLLIRVSNVVRPRRGRDARRGSLRGEVSSAVIIVTKYWPPPKLVRDLAIRCFGRAKVDLHVMNPPMDRDYVGWETVFKEVEALYNLYDGKVAVAIIPLGVEIGFVVALKEACELLGLNAFLAIAVNEGVIKGRKPRKAVFGPRHRRYVYLGLSREWVAGIMPLDADLGLGPGF